MITLMGGINQAKGQLTPDLAAKLESSQKFTLNPSEAIHSGDLLLYGVDKVVSGTDFVYAFPMKGINRSLLIRATDGTQSMEWTSQPTPQKIDSKTDFLNYVIPVGVGTNGSYFKMEMEIDGQSAFIFDNSDKESWELIDTKGRELIFESIYVDGNRDRRGFLYLRVPKDQAPKSGESLKLKITADKRASQSWFMVFTDKIQPQQNVFLSPAIIDNKQQLMVEVMHFGAPQTMQVIIDGKAAQSKEVVMGGNSFGVLIDKVKKPRNAKVELITNDSHQTMNVQIKPTPQWELFFIQQSHTDIGYTRPQNEILAEHIRYIDYALDYCDQTDHLPEEARFHWTCETTWAVEQFLLTRPKAQIERLQQRIKEGRIEVAGMIFNFSELPDEQSLVASLKPLETCFENNIQVEVAMQNDVNGMAWSFADYLPSLGVKYLNMGTHGHRALICFDYPTVFRWQSPSGNEMIGYRAEHYNTGNFFGVEKENFEDFENKVLAYLIELEAKGYPYEQAAIQFSGYFTDNSPPSMAACENIRKWNEKYTYPHLQLALSTEFIKIIEQEHYNELPVLKQAWPDWWTDGFGAAAREAAVGRYAKADMAANGVQLSMAQILGAQLPKNLDEQIAEVNSAILFYDEHTTGFSESVREPWCKPSMDQRALKESYAWEAYRRTRTLAETAAGILQEYTPRASTPSIVVYNTLNFPRTTIAHAYIDHEILPIDREFEVVDALTGKKIAMQPKDSRADGTYWEIRAENVPALGYRQLLIKVSDKKQHRPGLDTEPIKTVSNEFYNIEFDAKRGVIKSLYDKELGSELLESNDGRDMGEFVYERLAERGSMEAFTMGEFTRQGLDSIWYIGATHGQIYDTYRFAAQTIAGVDSPTSNFWVEYRVHHADKLIEIGYSITKKSQIEPEGIYIAFPFEMGNSSIFCEVPGGVMEAGVDQIEGSSNDWNTHQSFVAVRGDKGQVVMGSTEVPLMQFGAINTGRYKAGAKPESSNLYSWVMNNYWVTNFNSEQRGEFHWNYYITSMKDKSNSEATKFGWNERIPMPTRILPADENANELSIPQNGLFEISGGDILLVSAMPADDEQIMLHLREIGGKDSRIAIDGYQVVECDLLGRPIENGSLEMEAWGVKFVKIRKH